jgi:PhnB protein
MRMDDPSGKIHHAEISIGGSRIMLADEHPDIQALSPKTIGGSPVSIHLYVDDVDGAFQPSRLDPAVKALLPHSGH